MKLLFSSFVFLTCCFAMILAPTSALAGPAKTSKASKRKIIANTKIEVFEYLKDSDLFVVQITKEPDVGPNYVIPDQLVKSIGLEVSGSTLSKKNADYIGAQFVLKSELPLVSDSEVQKRKKK